MKFAENDVVRIISNKDNLNGKIGTIICSFNNPNEAYDVEILNNESEPFEITLLPEDIELYNGD